MKIRRRFWGILLLSVVCSLMLAFSVSAAAKKTVKKTTVRIAIPKTGNRNVQNAVEKYNKEKKVKYTVELTEVVSADIDVSKYDGLIIPGGSHVHPSFYGVDEVECTLHKYDKKLDQLEIDLVQLFKAKKKPILGICRGAQLLNVALGGTLKQDIGSKHYKWAYRATKSVKNTKMYSVFGKSAKTLHYHHQAIDKLGSNLKVSMWDSKDNCIEAYEHKTLPIYGVQFHPESMYTRKKNAAGGKKFLTYFFGVCAKRV